MRQFPTMLVGALLVGGALANPQTGADAGIKGWVKKNIAAYRKMDVKAIMALRTSDFHQVMDGKNNDHAAMVSGLTNLMAMTKSSDLQLDLGPIKTKGDTAESTVAQTSTRTQAMQDGKPHKVEIHSTQHYVWRKVGGAWKLAMVDNIKPGKILLDGKPFTRPAGHRG